MKCPNCGSPLRDGEKFCPYCGTEVKENAGTRVNGGADAQHDFSVPQGDVHWHQNPDGSWESGASGGNAGGGTRLNGGYGGGAYNYGGQQKNSGWQNAGQDPNLDYTPISMWGYLGYQILFSIPCVGLIFLLVFSLGGTRNINLRNFARSYFCFMLVIFVMFFVLGSCGLLGSSLYA